MITLAGITTSVAAPGIALPAQFAAMNQFPPLGPMYRPGLGGGSDAPYSNAPLSTSGGVPLPVSVVFGSSKNRGSPAKSNGIGSLVLLSPSRSALSGGTAAFFPASMQSEPAWRCKSSSAVPAIKSGPLAFVNRGSAPLLPMPPSDPVHP